MFETLFQFLFEYRPQVFRQGDFHFAPPAGAPLAAAVVVAALAMAFVSYRVIRARVQWRERAVLGLLRVAALAIILFCIFRPVLVVKAAVAQQNVVGILLDDSRSMGHWDNLQEQMRRVLPEGRWIEIDTGTESVWHSFFEIPNPKALAPPPIYDQSMVLRYYGIFENNDPSKRLMAAPSRMGGIEYSHPVFELFRAPRSGDYSAARFYNYRAVTQPAGQVLARFDDGSPALLERKAGAGRVLMWTSTVDLDWNDLAVKPVFLPFVHTITKYLADFSEPPASLTVGQVIPAPRKAAARGGTANRGSTIAVAPSGARVTVETEDGALELAEQGFYDVRTQGAGPDSATTLASNVDLSESDLSPLDPRELAAAVAGRAAGDLAGKGLGRPSDEAQAQAQRLWWYLLVAGGLLLAAETLLSNRLSQKGARVS